MQCGSSVALAVARADTCSSNWTLSLELPYATGTSLKKKKKRSRVQGRIILGKRVEVVSIIFSVILLQFLLLLR